MPVKVRCRDCEHQFSVPDAARGKSVKCKECGKPVKVPAGEAGPKKPAKPQKTIEDEDFFSKLDLDDVEHEDKRICPKCTQEVTDEDIECPYCGVNIETGQISTKQKEKQKIKRRGPDPDLFFKVTAKDSWAYLKTNFSLVTRLAIFWALASTIEYSCAFMANYCEKIPLKVFFGAISGISALAAVGSFFQLGVAVIKSTMDEKPNVGRFNFDFFEDVAWGLKAVLWPFSLWGIVLLSSLFILIPLAIFAAIFSDTVLGPIFALPFVFIVLSAAPALPVALSHMSAKYTYKAYLPNEMGRLTFKNFKPVVYWWMLAIGAFLPALLIAIPIGIFFGSVYEGFCNNLLWFVQVCSIPIEEDKRDWMFYLVVAFSGMIFMGIIFIVYGYLLATAGVFVMRTVGLFSYYNQATLEMGDKRVAGQPVGFWIRYLAFMIDLILVSIFMGCAHLGMFMFGMFLDELGVEGMEMSLAGLSKLLDVVIPLGYWVLAESGPGAGTLGKNSMGMQVVTLEGKKPITRGQAVARYFLRNIGGNFLGLGLLMCHWDKEKQTWHDKSSKTRVVWKPENY